MRPLDSGLKKKKKILLSPSPKKQDKKARQKRKNSMDRSTIIHNVLQNILVTLKANK